MSRVLLPLFSLALALGGLAQEPVEPAAEPLPPGEGETSREKLSRDALEDLAISLSEAQESLAAAKKELVDAPPDLKEDLSVEVETLQKRVENLTADLERVATGQESSSRNPPEAAPFDIQAELADLLEPLIEELKAATKSPRDLEELRDQISDLEAQLAAADNAISRLDTLRSDAGETLREELLPPLEELSEKWETRRQSAKTALSVANLKLRELEDARGNIIDSLREVFSRFFKTRGLNILLAVFAAVGVWLLLRWIWIRFEKMRHSRKADKGVTRTFSSRAAGVVFLLGSSLAAVVAALMVFYLAGDWVLLGLSILLILGIIWAGKTTLPRFFDQVKLMLNIGSVREGERVVIGGVPWEVKRLNLFSELTNPALEGGTLRLPIRDILPLNSRPFSPKEPWFPCDPGDWVRLADGLAGKVVVQSPEWVQLVLLGGSRKTFATSDFVAANPESLAHNFRVRSTFGIDYAHQAIATTEVPAIFTKHLLLGLTEEVGADNLVNVSVEFAAAGASSLDYEVLADFSGDVSSKSARLARTVQRLCVDACNENGWSIPFTQITLHQA